MKVSEKCEVKVCLPPPYRKKLLCCRFEDLLLYLPVLLAQVAVFVQISFLNNI